MEARYLTNEKGERVGVVLSVEEYERLVELEDELDSIQHFDEAMEAMKHEIGSYPWEKVRLQIGSERSNRARLGGTHR